MRVLIACTVACLALAESKEYATTYPAERSLRIEWESEYSLATTNFEVIVDGEPREMPGATDRSSSESRSVVQVDTIVATEDGRPTEVRRSFEAVTATMTTTRGGEESERERECPLNEVVLDLSLDDEGDVAAEVSEGTEPEDETLLQGHHLTLALDAFLPEGDVSEGDKWDLEAEAILEGLCLDLDAKLFPRPQRPEREGGGGRRGEADGLQRGQRGGRGMRGGANLGQMFRAGTWEGEGQLLVASEQYEGVDCAVIELKLECEGELPEQEPGGGGGGRRGDSEAATLPVQPRFENSFSIELEGKLYYSLADSRPLALELEGEVDAESSRVRQRGESEMEINSAQSGKLRFTATISTAASEDGEEEE